ncbi:DUF3298 and DUF4163 domain-containing protein [Anaerosinus massiliensis]|uniref:DUF3298 and DUF4163 domain-containing protein n=1 Tax=Massilibacillus massiliensis TaxID=1806837 RepID=UPI000DA5EE9C|nr:DUF4163 domain-containing protein [Massilibacillus massiliensis]
MKLLYLPIVLLLLCFTGFMPAIVNSMVQTGEQNGINYKINYPIVYTDNEIAQNFINDDISKYIDSFKETFAKGEIKNGGISYETKFEDDNIVSLTLTDSRYLGGAHGHYIIYGLVYDKTTGKRLPLTYFLNITPGQLRSSFSSGSIKIVNYKEQPIDSSLLLHPLEKITDNYYLTGDGSVSLIYQIYELVPYSEGSPHIKISKELVEHYNSYNKL